MSEINRLQTNDLELGVTEAVQQHVSRHVVAAKPVSQRKLDFEHARPRWLRECMAEATGVFFFVFPGIASIAGFTLNATNAAGVTAFSSLFQIGWAFAIGISFAIITCASTSGGHFNPAITLALALWQGKRHTSTAVVYSDSKYFDQDFLGRKSLTSSSVKSLARSWLEC